MKFKRPGPAWLLPPCPGLLQRGKVPTHIKAYIILYVRSTGAGIPCERFEKDAPRNYPHTSTYIYTYKYIYMFVHVTGSLCTANYDAHTPRDNRNPGSGT